MNLTNALNMQDSLAALIEGFLYLKRKLLHLVITSSLFISDELNVCYLLVIFNSN